MLEEAAASFEAAVQANPDNSEAHLGNAKAHYNLGIAYGMQGQSEEAVAEFEIYLQLQPDAENRSMVEEWIEELEGQ